MLFRSALRLSPWGMTRGPWSPVPLRRARSNLQPTPSYGAAAKELRRQFIPLPPPPPGLRLGPGVSGGPDFYRPGPLAKPSLHCPLGSQGQRSQNCCLHPAPRAPSRRGCNPITSFFISTLELPGPKIKQTIFFVSKKK